MADRQLDVHKFYGGQLVLYLREGHSAYHARIRLPGLKGYIRKTTGETDLFDARRVADEWYHDARRKVRIGEPVRVTTFEEAFEKWLERQKSLLSPSRYTYIAGTGRLYLVPFFGKHRMDRIGTRLVTSYWDWRLNYWDSPEGQERLQRARHARWSPKHPKRSTLGNVQKIPRNSTLKHEQACLRQFWKWAKAAGHAESIPDIDAPRKAGKDSQVRPAFELEEWFRLRQFLDVWANQTEGMNSYNKFQRKLLRNYIIFMAATGLRPAEARELKWSDVRFRVDKTGRRDTLLLISPNTKTGARTVVPLDEAVEVLSNMMDDVYIPMLDSALHDEQWQEVIAPNKRVYVFGNRADEKQFNLHKTFADVMKKSGLLKDSFGRTRTPYSLRHTYAHLRLLHGNVPINDLAKVMGTSISMIERHYGSHVTTLQRAHVHRGSLVPVKD